MLAQYAPYIVHRTSTDISAVSHLQYIMLPSCHKFLLVHQTPHPFSSQAYHITNASPLPFWSFISKVLQAVDLPPPRVKLPYLLIYYLSVLLQFVCFLLSPIVTIRPTFTPMRVALAGTHHYYSCSRATREFGYRPLVGLEEGLRRAVRHFRQCEEEEVAGYRYTSSLVEYY